MQKGIQCDEEIHRQEKTQTWKREKHRKLKTDDMERGAKGKQKLLVQSWQVLRQALSLAIYCKGQARGKEKVDVLA